MTAAPIAFRTNESKYSFAGSPRLINCYAEQQGPDAKAALAVMPCHGMKLFASPTDTPCRGTIFLEDLSVAYSVHSTSVFKIEEDGTCTRVGVIPGTDIVQISRNQADPAQISIHTGRAEFYIENDVVKKVTDSDLPAVKSTDYVGGYTVYGIEDRRFFISSINDCSSVNGLDYATAEQSPGPLVRVKGDRGEAFIFKTDSAEQWRNTGQADFPFELMGSVQKGLRAANAVATFDNTLIWPAHDNTVVRLNGSSPQRVSDHGIERKIENDDNPEDLIGFAHSIEGHTFYTLIGTDWSRSLDAATNSWHSRESYRTNKWRARFPFPAWGKKIVGDSLTGNLYELDKDTFTEGDDPLIWGVDFPILHTFPNGGIVDAVHFDVSTGNGAINATTVPKLMLSWSVDGGETWIGNRELSLGAYGNRVRVTTRRLGRFGPKGIQFRLRISDPVIRALVAADVAIRPLKR